jgi:hypothetical protein
MGDLRFKTSYDTSVAVFGPTRGIFSDPNRLAMVGQYRFDGISAEAEFKKEDWVFLPSVFVNWAYATKSDTTNLANLMPQNLGEPWKSVVASLPESHASIRVHVVSIGGKLSFPLFCGENGDFSWELFTLSFGAGIYLTHTKATIDGKSTNEMGAGATTVVGIQLFGLGLGPVEVFLRGWAQVLAGETSGGFGTVSGGVGFRP